MFRAEVPKPPHQVNRLARFKLTSSGTKSSTAAEPNLVWFTKLPECMDGYSGGPIEFDAVMAEGIPKQIVWDTFTLKGSESM